MIEARCRFESRRAAGVVHEQRSLAGQPMRERPVTMAVEQQIAATADALEQLATRRECIAERQAERRTDRLES